MSLRRAAFPTRRTKALDGEQARVTFPALGRSLGCFAVAQDVRYTMIATLGEGRLLYCGKA